MSDITPEMLEGLTPYQWMRFLYGADEWQEIFSKVSKRAWRTAYNIYVTSAAWGKKRRARLEIDQYRCTRCLSVSRLEIHHKTYRRIGWEDVENDLVTLCINCHTAEHAPVSQIITI